MRMRRRLTWSARASPHPSTIVELPAAQRSRLPRDVVGDAAPTLSVRSEAGPADAVPCGGGQDRGGTGRTRAAHRPEVKVETALSAWLPVPVLGAPQVLRGVAVVGAADLGDVICSIVRGSCAGDLASLPGRQSSRP